MKDSSQSGFTLFELIIVITIIGIISAVSFAFLGQSKNKGGDAGVQSNLVNARSQIEVYFANNNGSYDGACSVVGSNTVGKHVRTAAKVHGSQDPGYSLNDSGAWDTAVCHATTNAYAIWVPYKSSTASSPLGLCIDSNNVTREVTTPLDGGDVVCPDA